MPNLSVKTASSRPRQPGPDSFHEPDRSCNSRRIAPLARAFGGFAILAVQGGQGRCRTVIPAVLRLTGRAASV